jgi:uncharacterized protein YndB with AHSA1/START domain
MTEFERTRRLPADRDTVFAAVSDPHRMAEWLPTYVDAPSDVDELTAAPTQAHDGDRTVDAVVDARPVQYRLEWGTRGQGEYAGWLQVFEIDEGASDVTVHLSFFSEDRAGAPGFSGRVEESLDGALDRLERLVGD